MLSVLLIKLVYFEKIIFEEDKNITFILEIKVNIFSYKTQPLKNYFAGKLK